MKKAKKLIALMLTLALLLSLAAVPAGAAETVTLQDPGFEGNIWNDGIWSYWIEDGDWSTKSVENFLYSSKSDMTPATNGGDQCIKFYMSANGVAYFTQVLKNVPAGTYKMTVDAMGAEGETVAVKMGDMLGETVQSNSGWNNWKQASGTFTLTEDCAELIVGVKITCTTGGWGYFDNLTLTAQTEEPNEPSVPDSSMPNADFENGNTENWTLTGYHEVKTNGNNNKTKLLNLWLSDSAAKAGSASYSVKLNAGTYNFSFDIMGKAANSGLTYSVTSGETTLVQSENTIATTDWDNWQTITTSNFTLSEDGVVTFTLSGTQPAAYWGWLDNLKVNEVQKDNPVYQVLPLDNGDFEQGSKNWNLTGYKTISANSEASNTTNTLTLWLSDDVAASGAASYSVTLTAGTYYFAFDLTGAAMDSKLSYSITAAETELVKSNFTYTTSGWNSWNSEQTSEFTLEEETEVTFTISGTQPAAYWGHLDNLKLYGTGSLAEKTPDPVDADIYIPYIKGTGGDFMRGMDISSLLSVLNSGAKYYDDKGNELDGQGFMNYLAACGTNWVRIRVWNNPFDANGNGYGGGNCDIEAAKIMGKWATNAGMKVLIDFHYSDFWADPGKQQAPKAWAGYTVDQKADAIYSYTKTSLEYLIDNGVDVGMVQIGNETTSKFCGESNWTNICKLFNSGADAVRAVDEDILVAIHFTNPERATYASYYAKTLNDNNVDYDVFASSYYPYWHGTLENLTQQLKAVADTYGKKVIVAETSWAYTLDDGDGHDNTVRKNNNDSDADYTFSVQGQATEVAAVTQAVRNVGDAGIGVFYWEPAWTPVGAPENLEQNKALWEKYGSGWASSYAGEYDPGDAGVWYGGSAWDNQAMFAFDGTPLESLKTYLYMQTGTSGFDIVITDVEEPTLNYTVGDALALPEKLTVSFNVGADEEREVTWNAADVSAVNMDKPGTYVVNGTIEDDVKVTCTITVKAENLLKNPGMESSDMSMYTISKTYARRKTDDPHSGTYSMHFYNSGLVDFTAEQTVTLQPGHYEFSLFGQGGDLGEDAVTYAYVKIGEEMLTADFALTGWAIWVNPTISFAVSEETTVTVGINVTASQNGAWGTFDDWYLCEDVTAAHTPAEDDNDCTTAIQCIGCGAITTEAKADHTPAEDDGDCTTAIECTECGTVTTEARDSHTGGRATCCTKAVCEVCGKAYGETVSNRHSGGLAVLDRKVATEFEDGYSGDVYCLGCGKKIQTGKVIPATHVHSFDTADCTHAATCECGEISGEKDSTNHVGGTELKGAVDAEEFKDGYTGDTYCLGCGEIITKGRVIPATHVHVFSKATCSAPATCQCGETSGEKDSTNHVGGTEIKGAQAATEDAEGYTGDTHCLGCGEKLEAGKVIPKLEIEKPEDPKPEDPKPEDPKPEDTKPEDTKPEDENPKTGDLLWIHVVALLTSAAVLPTFKRRR